MRTAERKNLRLPLAAALFLALTALKLLLPAETAELRAEIRAVVSRDADYGQALEALGARLSGPASFQTLGGLGEWSREAVKPVAAYSPTTLPELRERMTSALPDGVIHAPPAREAAEEAPEELPEAVAAFLESQAQFAGEELPANVAYDMPEPPFEYQSPVTGVASSGFGFRLHPIKGEVKFHYGTDFAVWSGTDILAFASGTVSLSGWDDGYGNYLILDHGGGWQTLYAHCGEVLVSSGEQVEMGERLALSGASGEVTGPHLHFELMCSGKYYNPEFLLA